MDYFLTKRSNCCQSISVMKRSFLSPFMSFIPNYSKLSGYPPKLSGRPNYPKLSGYPARQKKLSDYLAKLSQIICRMSGRPNYPDIIPDYPKLSGYPAKLSEYQVKLSQIILIFGQIIPIYPDVRPNYLFRPTGKIKTTNFSLVYQIILMQNHAIHNTITFHKKQKFQYFYSFRVFY